MADLPSVALNPVADHLVEQDGEMKIPLFEETMSVSKHVVPTSRVQVSRVTHSHEELIDELLHREQIEIERTPMEKAIDTMPSIRQEGDVTVIPVVEEVVRVERHLVLKEEVRIRRVRTTERFQESVTLRKQEAVITRHPIGPSAASGAEAKPDSNQDKDEK
jgi:stress response protein YsnF